MSAPVKSEWEAVFASLPTPDEGWATAKAVAEVVHLSPSTVTRRLNALEEGGRVESSTDKAVTGARGRVWRQRAGARLRLVGGIETVELPAEDVLPDDVDPVQRYMDAAEQGVFDEIRPGEDVDPVGRACGKCGEPINPIEAEAGYTRCEVCDPDGDHSVHGPAPELSDDAAPLTAAEMTDDEANEEFDGLPMSMIDDDEDEGPVNGCEDCEELAGAAPKAEAETGTGVAPCLEEVGGSGSGQGKAEPPTVPARPIVLVASPVAGQPPQRAEVWEDNPSLSVVKVVYCESRASARVARKRILGPAATVTEMTELEWDDAVQRSLDKLHLTREQLTDMAALRIFTSVEAQKLWMAIGEQPRVDPTVPVDDEDGDPSPVSPAPTGGDYAAIAEALTPAADPLTAQDARALTDRIRLQVADLLPLIKEAYNRRAHVSLGYTSWAEYCDTELRGLRMPLAERQAATVELAAEGMSTRAIAGAIGSSDATVRRDLAAAGATDDAPERVTGLDGRSYPARKAKSEAEVPNALRIRAHGWAIMQRSSTQGGARIGPQGPEVWIASARKDVEYHRPDAEPSLNVTFCRRSMRTGERLPLYTAEERHAATPCPRCWPEPTAGAVAPAVPTLTAWLTATVHPVTQFERATGTYRDPRESLNLSGADITAVLDLDEPSNGPVAGVVLHTVSGNALTVGPFDSATAARAWWDVPFNRLRRNADVAFVLLPITPDNPAGPAAAPTTPGDDGGDSRLQDRPGSAPAETPTAEVGSDYKPDPAARIAAVAEVAPAYVQPVDEALEGEVLPAPAPAPAPRGLPDQAYRIAVADGIRVLGKAIDALEQLTWDVGVGGTLTLPDLKHERRRLNNLIGHLQKPAA